VHEEQAVHRVVSERQLPVFDQDAQQRAGRWPHERALRLGHQRGKAGRILSERSEVGYPVAEAGHRAAAQTAPARAHLAPHDPAHRQSERGLVEVSEVDDVEFHDERFQPAFDGPAAPAVRCRI